MNSPVSISAITCFHGNNSSGLNALQTIKEGIIMGADHNETAKPGLVSSGNLSGTKFQNGIV